VGVSLAGRRLLDESAYRRHFGAPLQFGEQSSFVRFPSSMERISVPDAGGTRRRVLEAGSAGLVARRSDPDCIDGFGSQ
jgi:hypothetical protein